MCINSDGNIGMGTTININERLIVNGNVKIDNGFLLTCNLIVGSLNAINILGVGSNITNINTSNITSGILPVLRGGTGINSLGINQILAGNSAGDRIINSGVGLTWNTNTNTLFASNISGIGSNITNINTSNITDGILSVARGGTGTNTLGANQVLVGNASGALISSSNLMWNNTTNTLNSTNVNATNINATNINATFLNGCNINSNFSKWTSSGSHIFLIIVMVM